MNEVLLESLVGCAFAAGLLCEKLALARALQKEGKKIMAQFDDAMTTAEQAATAIASSLTKISAEFDADLAALKSAGLTPDQIARLSAHSSGLQQLAGAAQALVDAHANDVTPVAPVAPTEPPPVVTPDPAQAPAA